MTIRSCSITPPTPCRSSHDTKSKREFFRRAWFLFLLQGHCPGKPLFPCIQLPFCAIISIQVIMKDLLYRHRKRFPGAVGGFCFLFFALLPLSFCLAQNPYPKSPAVRSCGQLSKALPWKASVTGLAGRAGRGGVSPLVAFLLLNSKKRLALPSGNAFIGIDVFMPACFVPISKERAWPAISRVLNAPNRNGFACQKGIIHSGPSPPPMQSIFD